MKNKSLLFTVSLVLAGILAACGGGGGGTAAVTGDTLVPAGLVTLDATAFEFTGAAGDSGAAAGDGGAGGAAGDGAPIRKAVIVITDATGKTASGLTDDTGNYFIKFIGFTAPLVAKVIDAGGNVLASATEEQPTAGRAVRIMINPLTDKIVSDSVVDGVVPGTDKAFDGSKVDLAKFATAKTNLRTSINAALAAAGITSAAFDPIKSKYAYDGTGVDAVIESISHTRDPNTGVTQLRAKLVNVDTTTLITAAAPLAATNVALPTNQTLTYAKLQAWTNQLNACLAMTPGSVTPCDNNAKGLRSNNYLHNSKDFEEDFRTAWSDGASRSTSERVPNVSVRNPVVLYVGKYPNSTATHDDLAVVEMTVKQPYIGPLGPNGSSTDPVEYVAYFIFKRDDTLVGASGGNWTLHGNQRAYDMNVSPRIDRYNQVNTANNANSTGNIPSALYSTLRLAINPQKYDSIGKTYVSANIRAVRVTGPGLPTVGVVMTPSATIGATLLAVYNQTGVVPATAVTTGATLPGLRLAGVALDGSALYSGFWPASLSTAGLSGGGQSHVIPAMTDFSALPAFSRYQFEVFLNSNLGTTTPDTIEFSRTLAPVVSPSVARAMPVNDIGASAASVTPPQLGGTSATINWTINLNAAPVTTGCVFAEERNPKGSTTTFTRTTWSHCKGVAAAYSVNIRPSSVTANASATSPLPSFTTQAGDLRELSIRSWQGRTDVSHYVRWTN